jgi:uncharacterized DUF497 family protein
MLSRRLRTRASTASASMKQRPSSRPARADPRGRHAPRERAHHRRVDRRAHPAGFFVERDGDTLRLISARRATSHERRRYEEGA